METRAYNLADAIMLTFAATHRGLFIQHQADFSDFDPDFGSPDYENNWQTAITAALNIGTAETRDDQLGFHTAQVNSAMKAITLKVKDVKYFAFKTFPPEGSEENRSILDEFGFDNYQEVYGEQAGIRVFMAEMFKAATKHAAAMAAKGFTPAKLAEIETVTQNFLDLDAEQNTFRQSEPLDTDLRVKTMNHAWSFSRQVRQAAEVVYAENPVMYNLFLFPRRTEAPDTFNVIGTASHAITGAPSPGVTVAIPQLGMQTTTDQDGNFGFAMVPPGPAYTMRFTAPGLMQMDIPFSVSEGSEPTVVNAILTPMP